LITETTFADFAFDAGCADAFFDFQVIVPEYIRPLFCTGTGPFRWVALSGDPRDIDRTTSWRWSYFPRTRFSPRWLRLARGRFAFQGLPARICWLGYGERAKMGLAINELVRKGEISAPIAIGAPPGHRLCGQPPTARRRRCWMDGRRWPTGRYLNALLNTASGATWVSFHHGGGVGNGYSLHAGQVTVATYGDGGAQDCRVLNNDPGLGSGPSCLMRL